MPYNSGQRSALASAYALDVIQMKCPKCGHEGTISDYVEHGGIYSGKLRECGHEFGGTVSYIHPRPEFTAEERIGSLEIQIPDSKAKAKVIMWLKEKGRIESTSSGSRVLNKATYSMNRISKSSSYRLIEELGKLNVESTWKV